MSSGQKRSPQDLSGPVLLLLSAVFLVCAALPSLAASTDDPLLTFIKAADSEGFKKAAVSLPIPKDQAGPLLIEAAQDNQTEIAQILLDKGADAGYLDAGGNTPLILAAEKGNIALATLLLAKGADVNFQGRAKIEGSADETLGDTALIAAVKHFQIPMIQFLLAQGAEIGHLDAGGKTTLTIAVQGGNQTIIEALTEKSVVDHFKSPLRGDLSVLYAYLAGRRDIVKLLIDRGLPADRRSDHNYSALMAAAYDGDEEMVRLFLSKNADPNAATFPPTGFKVLPGQTYSFGWTPLMYAAAGGHVLIVSLLLQAHANIDLVNSDGKKAINLARTANFPEVVNVLDEGNNILWGYK